jgi:hypothetical protein
MRIERALASPEDIRALAAADLANEFTAVARPTDDLLERHSVPNQHRDGGINLLAPQIALILQSFRTGEQLRRDRGRADCGTDHAHGPAHRVEECRARVLHQVPAIGDLDSVRQRLCGGLAVTAATIARYDPDPGMFGKPSPHRCNLAIGQQRYDPPALQIADYCSVAMVPPREGPSHRCRQRSEARSAGSFVAERSAAGYHCSRAASVAWRSLLPAYRRAPGRDDGQCIPAVLFGAIAAAPRCHRTAQRKSSDGNAGPHKRTAA